MNYLSPYDLLVAHQVLLHIFGGMPGITAAGYGRLETAAHAPRQSMFGADLYPTLADKTAALVHSLIHSHPFSDGNKRTAVVALDVMLRLNGADLVASNEEVYDLAMAVAAGMPRETLRQWIVAHCPTLAADAAMDTL